MTNIKLTENHIKNIKKHKKFLECWNIWPFGYYDGEKYYCNVTYYRGDRDNITGYLILDIDGNLVPFEKAILPLKYMAKYNSYIYNTGTEIGKRILINTYPIELMNQLIEKYKSNILLVYPDLTKSIEKIIENNNDLIKQPKIVKEIYQRIYDYNYEMINKTKFIEIELLDLIENEINNYREIMYKNGVNEISIREDFVYLLKALKSKNIKMPKIDKYNLVKLLKETIRSIDRDLKKTIETFEVDELGNKITIDSNNIRESLIQNNRKIGEYEFKRFFISKLRNNK